MNELTPPESPRCWPAEYVPLDGGSMWVRPDCVVGFQQRGWTTLDAVMSSDALSVVRRRRTRDNCVLQLETDDGPVCAHLKRHRVRSWDDWRRERGVRRAADTPGMAEAEAVEWCRAAGVPTMSVIAAGSRQHPDSPRQSDSFFLSEALSGCLPACDLWHDPGIGAEARERAIVAMAETARRFHDAGLYHYDFYLDHFFISQSQLQVPGESVTACLMDLQRVERLSSGFAGWRAEIKDLGQFYGSCCHHGVSEHEQQLWVHHYFNGDGCEVNDVCRRDSAKLTAARARWELRQLRRRVLTHMQRAGTLFG